MTAWTDAVSSEFKMGRKNDPKFSLKMAMIKAKKSYKKMNKTVGKTMKKRGGSGITHVLSPQDVNASDSVTVDGPSGGVGLGSSLKQMGGKSKKSKKSMKSKKSRK